MLLDSHFTETRTAGGEQPPRGGFSRSSFMSCTESEQPRSGALPLHHPRWRRTGWKVVGLAKAISARALHGPNLPTLPTRTVALGLRRSGHCLRPTASWSDHYHDACVLSCWTTGPGGTCCAAPGHGSVPTWHLHEEVATRRQAWGNEERACWGTEERAN